MYHDDPLAAAVSWVDGGRALPPRRGSRRRPRRACRPRSSHLSRIARRARACRSSTAAACATPGRCATALEAGAERVIVGTAALRDVDFLDEIVARARHARRRVGGRARRADRHSGLDAGDRPAGHRGDRAPARPRRRVVHLHRRRSRRRAGGPVARGRRRRRPAVRGRFLYAGGIGELAHLRALRALRQVNLAGVIVGKALYERRFSVAEGQAALRSDKQRREPAALGERGHLLVRPARARSARPRRAAAAGSRRRRW